MSVEEEFKQEVQPETVKGTFQDVSSDMSKAQLLTKAPVDVSEGTVNEVDVAEKWDEFNYKTISEEDLMLIYTHLEDRTTAEWLEILRRLEEYHSDDECVPRELRKFLAELLEGPLPNMTMEEWRTMVAFETFLIYEWSIYPEVRFATRPIDEEDEDDYENLRTYIVSIIWACAGCALDTFFEIRNPGVTIDSGAVQLLICLTGQLWARLPRIVMPFPRMTIPLWKGQKLRTPNKLVINSGHPWTFKEQTFAYLGMAVCLTYPQSQAAVIAIWNENFLNQPSAKGYGFPVLLTLTTNFLGFGISGFFRAFCVYPTKCIWYDIMPWLVLNRALVKTEVREKVNGWPFTSHEFFWLVSWISFGWFWITNLVWQSLSYFSWTAWQDPTDRTSQAMTGYFNGLGMNPISTFDLNIIGFSCVFIPWKIQVMSIIGALIGMFAMLIMWYTNVRYSSYLPINSLQLYANDGQPFEISQVTDESGLNLDMDKYQAYSAPYYPAGYLTSVAADLAYIPGFVTYTALRYGGMLYHSFANLAKGSWTGQGKMSRGQAAKAIFKSLVSPADVLSQFDTRFTRVMMKYPETPESWYMVMFVISIVLCIVLFAIYDFLELKWIWTVFMALGFALVFVYPDNVLRARTTHTFSLSTVLEIISGVGLKGHPTGVIMGRVFAIQVLGQVDNWVNQLAMANYVGIAQRALFRIQVVTMVCVSLVEAGLISWQTSGALKDICGYTDGNRRFTCPNERSTFNAAVQYGLIGPQVVFQQLYPSLGYIFLFGALYPVPFWLGRKYFGKIAARFRSGSYMNRIFHGLHVFLNDYVNEMVVLIGTASLTNANGGWSHILPNFEVGAFLRKWVEPRYPRLWAKYAFVFYSSVGVGNAFGALFNFFATEYNHIATINWGGNSIYKQNNDYLGQNLSRIDPPLQPLPNGSMAAYFGPHRGHLPI